MNWLEKMMDRLANAEREGSPNEHAAEAAFDALASDSLVVDDNDDLCFE